MKTYSINDVVRGGIWLAAVMLSFILFTRSSHATPQTSDADLRMAQVPPLVWGETPNFRGLRTKLAGALGSTDLRLFSGGIASLDLSDVTELGSGDYAFDGIGKVTGVDSFLALLPESDFSLQFTNCGLTDVSSFLTVYNEADGTNISLYLDNNPINGAVGPIGRTHTGEVDLSLTFCGITGVGTLGNLNGTTVQLSDNQIGSLDLSTGACLLDEGYLLVSRNPLTTIIPGDGTTSGIVTANGSSIYLDDGALPSSQINGLLAALVTMAINTGSVGELNIASGTNGAPTGAGLDDVDTLVLMGWSVTNN